MRAWLAILRERHPSFTWIAVEQQVPEVTPSAPPAGPLPAMGTQAIQNEMLVRAA
jgi:hypothetical protein